MDSSKAYRALAAAIVEQAVKDFKPAYMRFRHFPGDERAQSDVRELVEFFHSDYFVLLCDLDGKALVKQLMDEVDKRSIG